jgi:hypothetical protein
MRFYDFYKLFAEESSVSDQSYKGEHEAPGPDYGAPMFDLRLNGMFPPDVYSTMGHYRYGATGEDKIISMLYNMIGNQKTRLKIYRAIPDDLNVRINKGDWVTPVRSYAMEHGRSSLNNKFKIITKTVSSRDIWTNGDSLMEWGYYPTDFDKEYEQKRLAEKYSSIIKKINDGEKIYKINATPEDKWFDREDEYIANLYKRLPFLKQSYNEDI